MVANGFFLMYRKIFDNPVVTKTNNHFFVFCWLLGHAVYDNETRAFFAGKEIILKPGQLILKVSETAQILNVSYQQLLRILKDLKNGEQIEEQGSNRSTLITLLNWDKYQSKEQKRRTNRRASGELAENWRRTSEEHTNILTNKQVNNKTNNKSEVDKIADSIAQFSENQEVRQALTDYVDMRRTTNFPLNAKEFDYCLKTLQSYTNVESEQMQIIGRAIGGHYQNFAPLPLAQKKKGKAEAMSVVDRLMAKYEREEQENGQKTNS